MNDARFGEFGPHQKEESRSERISDGDQTDCSLEDSKCVSTPQQSTNTINAANKEVEAKADRSDWSAKDSQENRSDQRDAKKDRSERTANIFRESSGNVLGAAIWLNAAELNRIGINVDDTECVEVCIENGDLQLVAAIGDENQ